MNEGRISGTLGPLVERSAETDEYFDITVALWMFYSIVKSGVIVSLEFISLLKVRSTGKNAPFVVVLNYRGFVSHIIFYIESW